MRSIIKVTKELVDFTINQRKDERKDEREVAI